MILKYFKHLLITATSWALSSSDEILVGGQAVIEGVMMRNKEHFAVAVRTKDGIIKIKKERVRTKKRMAKNKKATKIFLFLMFARAMAQRINNRYIPGIPYHDLSFPNINHTTKYVKEIIVRYKIFFSLKKFF